MENTLLVGTENTERYYKRYKTKLGRPFKDMDKLFVHWLDNHFGTDCCFDQRFLKNHEVEFDIIRTDNYTVKFFLYRKNGCVELDTDFVIVRTIWPETGKQDYSISYEKSAFDFDVIDAILNNLMQMRLVSQ